MGPFDAECKRCKRLAAGAAQCSYCGAELTADPHPMYCGACGRATGHVKRKQSVGTWGIVALVVVIAGALIAGAIAYVSTADAGRQAVQSFDNYEALEQSYASGVTLAQFNAVQSGMTRAEVETVLGPGTLMSQVDMGRFGSSEMYTWDGAGGFGANMNVTYSDGRVTAKAQLGLR